MTDLTDELERSRSGAGKSRAQAIENRMTLVWPLANAAVPVTLMALLHERSPFVEGNYPDCPFLSITGSWCPGCGAMRALALMSQGRIFDALSYNVLVVTWSLVSIGIAGWWLWRTGRAHAPPIIAIGTRTGQSIALAISVFAVARNLPWQPLSLLAPG